MGSGGLWLPILWGVAAGSCRRCRHAALDNVFGAATTVSLCRGETWWLAAGLRRRAIPRPAS